jgi:NADPH:quinone reductase-like Zn-dependent oxidoreductase
MPATTALVNTAAWLPPKHAALEVRSAPYTRPGPDEIVVDNRALAVNPLEWMIQVAGNLMYPWLKQPFILGSDVAGEVVEIGSSVTRFAVGDRVIGHAVGTDKDSNSSARGAFQRYAIVFERLATPIPSSMPFADAVVLPLALSTAACGLFLKDQLALEYPTADPTPTGKTLLVWGGSTSVGSNAIQLAVAAGYDVISTASPRNFDYVTGLGATRVFDYRSPSVVGDIVAALTGRTVAGAIAIGKGSADPCADILGESTGNRFIAIATPAVSFERLADVSGPNLELPRILARLVSSSVALQLKTRRKGIRSKFIWGSDLKKTELGAVIYENFLPSAIADGRFVAAPKPLIVGHGLESIQAGLDAQRKGVSARKVVITL